MFFRRFYLDQTIFEFDPVEMMFTCLYLASQVDEIAFSLDPNGNIEKVVELIRQPKFCTSESKHHGFDLCRNCIVGNHAGKGSEVPAHDLYTFSAD